MFRFCVVLLTRFFRHKPSDPPPGTMPSERDLVQAGQGALVGAVRRAGGYRLLAGRLRLAGRRRARGTWHSAEALARELAEFAR